MSLIKRRERKKPGGKEEEPLGKRTRSRILSMHKPGNFQLSLCMA